MGRCMEWWTGGSRPSEPALGSLPGLSDGKGTNRWSPQRGDRWIGWWRGAARQPVGAGAPDGVVPPVAAARGGHPAPSRAGPEARRLGPGPGGPVPRRGPVRHVPRAERRRVPRLAGGHPQAAGVPGAAVLGREAPRSPARGAAEPGPGANEDLAQSGTSVLAQLSRDEEHERLELARSWCRADDLAIIARHLDEGRSHEDIAAELGVAVATARQRYSRAVRRIGEALHLLELMTRRGWDGPRQDAVGLHRFQGAGPRQIADRLLLPEELVARWIDDAGPLLRAIARDAP